MTRRHAAKRLLEHGPLTADEMRQITGWSVKVVHTTLWHLANLGVVESSGPWGKRVYGLV